MSLSAFEQLSDLQYANEIQMRLGWGIEKSSGGWHVLVEDESEDWWPDKLAAYCCQHSYPDPTTAIVKTHEWYVKFCSE